MAHGDLVFRKIVLDDFGEVEKPEIIGHGSPVLPNTVRDLLLGVVQFPDQSLIDMSDFQGVEVFPMEVFNQRDFKLPLLRYLAAQDRNLPQPRLLGRSPSPLSDDYLVPLALRHNEDGLDDTAFLHRP